MKRIAQGEQRTAIRDFRAAIRAAVVVLMLTIAAAAPARAQTFTVLHSFTGQADGGNPYSGLTLDRAGHLYGTAYYGGGSCYFASGCGTVFRMKRSGSGWIFAPIYSFTDSANDGAFPSSRVTIGPDGSLYGGNYFVLYNLKPPPTAPTSVFAPWTESLVYGFSYLPDGFHPTGDLVFDSAGNIYGTTEFGGPVNRCDGGLGCGTAYELTLSNGVWTATVLYMFEGTADGQHPMSGAIFDHSGALYGTTSQGYYDNGAQDGAVFELTPSGPGWTENTLYDFQPGTGGYPWAGLIFDGKGNLYGVTAGGGLNSGGTAFEMTPSPGGWTYNTIYNFVGSPQTRGPYGTLAMDAAGNLYGTTVDEGLYGLGTVFKLTPGAGGWTYTSLHDFTGGSDGANPFGGVVLDANGNLYGTASEGGSTGARCDATSSYQCGVVFQITP